MIGIVYEDGARHGKTEDTMISSKVAAMQRIAEDTKEYGASNFPQFMMQNMRQWEREGLVKLSGNNATLTEAGRRLAKKAMA